MAQIKLQQAHSQGKAKARQSVESIARTMGKQYKAQSQWEGDNLIFRATGVTGRIHVADTSVFVVIDLSPGMSLLRGVISSGFEQQLQAAFR